MLQQKRYLKILLFSFFFYPHFFIGVGSSKRVLKIFWGGLWKDILCNSLLGYLSAHTGNDCWVHYFYRILFPCNKVMQLKLKGTFKSWFDWLKVTASGSDKSPVSHLLFFFFFLLFSSVLLGQCETLPWEKEILNKQLRFLSSVMAVLELWTVQFAVKRLWIDLPVQLVIIERSSSSLDARHWLSKDLSPHCHLCVRVRVSV